MSLIPLALQYTANAEQTPAAVSAPLASSRPFLAALAPQWVNDTESVLTGALHRVLFSPQQPYSVGTFKFVNRISFGVGFHSKLIAAVIDSLVFVRSVRLTSMILAHSPVLLPSLLRLRFLDSLVVDPSVQFFGAAGFVALLSQHPNEACRRSCCEMLRRQITNPAPLSAAITFSDRDTVQNQSKKCLRDAVAAGVVHACIDLLRDRKRNQNAFTLRAAMRLLATVLAERLGVEWSPSQDYDQEFLDTFRSIEEDLLHPDLTTFFLSIFDRECRLSQEWCGVLCALWFGVAIEYDDDDTNNKSAAVSTQITQQQFIFTNRMNRDHSHHRPPPSSSQWTQKLLEENNAALLTSIFDVLPHLDCSASSTSMSQLKKLFPGIEATLSLVGSIFDFLSPVELRDVLTDFFDDALKFLDFNTSPALRAIVHWRAAARLLGADASSSSSQQRSNSTSNSRGASPSAADDEAVILFCSAAPNCLCVRGVVPLKHRFSVALFESAKEGTAQRRRLIEIAVDPMRCTDHLASALVQPYRLRQRQAPQQLPPAPPQDTTAAKLFLERLRDRRSLLRLAAPRIWNSLSHSMLSASFSLPPSTFTADDIAVFVDALIFFYSEQREVASKAGLLSTMRALFENCKSVAPRCAVEGGLLAALLDEFPVNGSCDDAESGAFSRFRPAAAQAAVLRPAVLDVVFDILSPLTAQDAAITPLFLLQHTATASAQRWVSMLKSVDFHKVLYAKPSVDSVCVGLLQLFCLFAAPRAETSASSSSTDLSNASGSASASLSSSSALSLSQQQQQQPSIDDAATDVRALAAIAAQLQTAAWERLFRVANMHSTMPIDLNSDDADDGSSTLMLKSGVLQLAASEARLCFFRRGDDDAAVAGGLFSSSSKHTNNDNKDDDDLVPQQQQQQQQSPPADLLARSLRGVSLLAAATISHSGSGTVPTAEAVKRLRACASVGGLEIFECFLEHVCKEHDDNRVPRPYSAECTRVLELLGAATKAEAMAGMAAQRKNHGQQPFCSLDEDGEHGDHDASNSSASQPAAVAAFTQFVQSRSLKASLLALHTLEKRLERQPSRMYATKLVRAFKLE